MFPLMIDQETDFMLNLTVQWALKGDGFTSDLDHYGLREAYDSFRKRMNEGLKEMAWCNHPDCRGKEITNCGHKDD